MFFYLRVVYRIRTVFRKIMGINSTSWEAIKRNCRRIDSRIKEYSKRAAKMNPNSQEDYESNNSFMGLRTNKDLKD